MKKRVKTDQINITAEKYRLDGIALRIGHRLTAKEQATLVDLLLQNLGIVTTNETDNATVVCFLPIEEKKPFPQLCLAARECLRILFPNPLEPYKPSSSKPRKLSAKELEKRALSKKQREYKKELRLKLSRLVSTLPGIRQAEWEKNWLTRNLHWRFGQILRKRFGKKKSQPFNHSKTQNGSQNIWAAPENGYKRMEKTKKISTKKQVNHSGFIR
jgi:hypothetical protein